jgi:hypothetical protein
MLEKTMFFDVEIKYRKRNRLLFSRDSLCLQSLMLLMQAQTHRTLVLWALDCAQQTLAYFNAEYPGECRPSVCLALCEAWAKGMIKMPAAKRAILDAHAVAKEIQSPQYGALCHAIGHAGATVHVKTHALGLPIYELTSLVHRYGMESFQKPVGDKIDYYYSRLLYWQHTDTSGFGFARFLMDD